MTHRAGLPTWIGSLAGIGAGLAVLFMSALTLSVIFETLPLQPDSLVSWKELGCCPVADDDERERALSSVPQFLGVTECGRGYIAKFPRDSAFGDGSSTNTTVYDIWSNQAIFSYKAVARYSSDREVLSNSRRFLLQSRAMDGVILRDLVKKTEVILSNNVDGCPQFSFNKACDAALIRTDRGGVLWDLTNGTQLSAFQRPRKALSFGFSDAERHAKCLTISDSIEIWNEEGGFREFGLSEESIDASRYEGYQLSSDARTMAVIESDRMTIWSLQDGSLLHTIDRNRNFFRSRTAGGSTLLQCELNMALSNNSRWLLIYRHYREDPLITRAERWNRTLGNLLSTFLPNGQVSELVDLRSGETWPGMPCVLAGAFSDDDSRLITFSEDGKREWSVPSRHQGTTAWWLAVIGGWGGLIAILWRLRNGRRTVLSGFVR